MHLRYEGGQWGQECESGRGQEGSMFLAGGIQGVLNMSFWDRLLSGSPREARWGVQSAVDKGVWSRREDIGTSPASGQGLNPGVLSSESEDRKVSPKPVCPDIGGEWRERILSRG